MVVMERWHRGCTVTFRAVRASLAPSAPSSGLLPKAPSCPSWKIRAVRGGYRRLFGFVRKKIAHAGEMTGEKELSALAAFLWESWGGGGGGGSGYEV